MSNPLSDMELPEVIFAIGTNMARALLLVSNRLDRVTGYPEEANEPNTRAVHTYVSKDDSALYVRDEFVDAGAMASQPKPARIGAQLWLSIFGSCQSELGSSAMSRSSACAPISAIGSAILGRPIEMLCGVDL